MKHAGFIIADLFSHDAGCNSNGVADSVTKQQSITNGVTKSFCNLRSKQTSYLQDLDHKVPSMLRALLLHKRKTSLTRVTTKSTHLSAQTYATNYSFDSRQPTDIPKSDHISLKQFEGDFLGRQPLMLQSQFRHLPAIEKWPREGFTYLRKYGSVMVPIELSRGNSTYAASEDAQDFEKIEVPLDMFLDFVERSERSRQEGIPADEVKIYLAQHALFDSIPELYADVCSSTYREARHTRRLVPELATAGRGDIYNVNAWIGNSTHTPVRFPQDSVFCKTDEGSCIMTRITTYLYNYTLPRKS